MSKKMSVVVPCYNEELSINKFYDSIVPILTPLCDYELIFVNDGSADKTREILGELAKNDSKVKVVNFSRNFGQQSAIICGFRHATGDCAIELDCDLQDPVEIIPEMYAKWLEGYQVVHGKRKKRKGESVFKRLTASLYYKFLAKISQAPIPKDTGDFKLLDRKVLDVICNMSEHDKYLRGLESWVGFKQTFVEFDRQERVAGETHYTLKKMADLAKSGIVSNSDYPLTLSIKFGIFLNILSLLGFVALIVLSCLKVPFDLSFWILPTVTIMTSFYCIFNGLTNLYLSRVYLEVKNRPEYIIDEEINF